MSSRFKMISKQIDKLKMSRMIMLKVIKMPTTSHDPDKTKLIRERRKCSRVRYQTPN